MVKNIYLTGLLVLLLSAGVLFGCGKSSIKPAEPEAYNVEQSFEKANKLIESKDYEAARVLLLEIKNRDLTKKYAPLAQLRVADAYVKDEPDLQWLNTADS
jgi:outer membrane protein assembly factor BamD